MRSTSTWRKSPPDRPFIVLKTALSLDGHIDDAASQRKVFSTHEDANAVAALRAEADAILVGAETIRRDDPRLAPPSGAASGHPPLKVTLTRSGDLPTEARFFTAGDGPKLVYADRAGAERLRAAAVSAEIVQFPSDADSEHFIVRDLFKRGVRKLLVEGGTQVITAFLERDLVDLIRLAVAPELIADPSAPKLVLDELRLPTDRRFAVTDVSVLGAMTVIELDRVSATENQ
ncbi:MAG: RibD family protein [Bdellovibrionota bacterium]